jgi:protein-tyrosine phosphatase
LSSPLPYPSDREAIVQTFRWPLGRLWLRILARLMEWLTDIQPKQLNYSDVTPQLAVGGAFRNRQIKRLKQRGVTAVVDCRLEAEDDPEALGQAGIQFLHLPTLDRHGFTYEQLHEGVDWVLDHVANGGRAFMHCEHGVGRGPLMACAVLVGQGYSAPEALRIVRTARWQALPNDRQLAALLNFEREWRAQQQLSPEGTPPEGKSVAY